MAHNGNHHIKAKKPVDGILRRLAKEKLVYIPPGDISIGSHLGRLAKEFPLVRGELSGRQVIMLPPDVRLKRVRANKRSTVFEVL